MDAIQNTKRTILAIILRKTIHLLCGKHESQDEATEDIHTQEMLAQQKTMIEESRDVLVNRQSHVVITLISS